MDNHLAFVSSVPHLDAAQSQLYHEGGFIEMLHYKAIVNQSSS